MAEKTHAETIREAAATVDAAITALAATLLLMKEVAPDAYHRINDGINALQILTTKGERVGKKLREVADEIEAKEAA